MKNLGNLFALSLIALTALSQGVHAQNVQGNFGSFSTGMPGQTMLKAISVTLTVHHVNSQLVLIPLGAQSAAWAISKSHPDYALVNEVPDDWVITMETMANANKAGATPLSPDRYRVIKIARSLSDLGTGYIIPTPVNRDPLDMAEVNKEVTALKTAAAKRMAAIRKWAKWQILCPGLNPVYSATRPLLSKRGNYFSYIFIDEKGHRKQGEYFPAQGDCVVQL